MFKLNSCPVEEVISIHLNNYKDYHNLSSEELAIQYWECVNHNYSQSPLFPNLILTYGKEKVKATLDLFLPLSKAL